MKNTKNPQQLQDPANNTMTYHTTITHDTVIDINLSTYLSDTIRYDTIEEFNMDSKAEYSALSSTHLAHVARKKETKTNQRQCPFNTVQVKICKGSPEGIRVTMEERICERDEF